MRKRQKECPVGMTILEADKEKTEAQKKCFKRQRIK